MRVIDSCAKCLWDKQKNLADDKEYLNEIKSIIDNRKEDDTAPYLVYLFNKVYEKKFGAKASYKKIKKKYNDLVLSMENRIREKIELSDEPLLTALIYARIGNYIDFGAMNSVDENTFLSLFDNPQMRSEDKSAVESFFEQCRSSKTFLLLTDNCGEIVLDKLFLERLSIEFPHLDITVMVRGADVLNDATLEDALYVGLDKDYKLVSNGNAVAGTVYEMLSDEAQKVFDSSDVILAKGQGNYESMCRQGRHVFYSFLCKCDLFTERFGVPKLTGVFVEEK